MEIERFLVIHKCQDCNMAELTVKVCIRCSHVLILMDVSFLPIGNIFRAWVICLYLRLLEMLHVQRFVIPICYFAMSSFKMIYSAHVFSF